MARFALSLLGPVQATLDGQLINHFAYDKVRALLVYLAVESGAAHARDALAGLLWPELPNAAARTNLRQALTTLRQALDDLTAASAGAADYARDDPVQRGLRSCAGCDGVSGTRGRLCSAPASPRRHAVPRVPAGAWRPSPCIGGTSWRSFFWPTARALRSGRR